MAMHPFHRTELLVGGADWATLQHSRVCVIGLGGVGSYAAEALVRAGIGHVTLVDFDSVCITNVNRQLMADRRTVGQPKADLMGERARAINPKADIRVIPRFYGPTTSEEILGDGYDIVLDCIDNMTAKVHLLVKCHQRGQRVMSAMGAGGRMDPSRIRVSDIGETRVDPFARIVRSLLREQGIDGGIEVVWTDEPPLDLDPVAEASFRCICANRDDKDQVHGCERRQVQGTVSWLPAMFGLTMAATAVHRLLGRDLGYDRRAPEQHRMRPTDKPSRERKKALLQAVGLGRQGGPARTDTRPE